VHSEACLRLKELESEVQADYMELVDERRSDYAELQLTITETEQAIEAIVERHPEWFTKKRSVRTPYGVVKCTRTTKLDVPNEEATILLIERDTKKDEQEQYIRTSKTLNLEALESLSDEQLAAFRIFRVRSESIKIEEGKIDLGKAVKSAAIAEQKAEVAA
jgi:hypothetical protein